MDAVTFFWFVAGLVLLTVGAEALVRGASRLASAAGISALVVGLTVVAFGTSAPELAVGVRSALLGDGGSGIALGSVVGSNVFNVLFILGASAALVPLAVSRQLIRVDVPIMIGLSFLVLFLARDGVVSRGDGLLLFSGILAYVVFTVVQGKREERRARAERGGDREERPPYGAKRLAVDLLLILGGLGGLVLGARWLVDGAVEIARGLGLSELVIGLTLVAAGTSLPEVATSILASLRGERDIAVGNVVGSNIFNLLAVLGASAAAGREGVAVSEAALRFDLPVMVAVAVACLPIFFTGQEISRWEGWLFLGYYAAYVAYLFLAATHHDALPVWSAVMLAFVVPLTVVTLAVTVWRQVRRDRS